MLAAWQRAYNEVRPHSALAGRLRHSRAMQFDGGEANYRADVINYWGSHLQTLLAEGANVGYPWFKLDFYQIEKLGKESTRRCDKLLSNADTFDKILTELDIRDEVAEVINLATVQTLHAVSMKSNPRTRVLLLRLNNGLLGLRDNGTFRALAAKHL